MLIVWKRLGLIVSDGNMRKIHLLWIIPLTIALSIVFWEGFVVKPSEQIHWDLTLSCLEKLYNVTICKP